VNPPKGASRVSKLLRRNHGAARRRRAFRLTTGPLVMSATATGQTNIALDAVRAELALLRPRLASLESAEEVLSSAFEDAPARPVLKRPAPRKRNQTQPQRSPSRAEIRAYIAANSDCPRAQILAALGGRAKSVDGHLARMVAGGQIESRGARGRRRYRCRNASGELSLPQPATVATSLPERGVYPTYDAILDAGGATTDQLAQATKLPVAQVVDESRKLLRFGLIQFSGDADERRWSARALEARR
jgi:hypothetical protein